MHKLLQIMKQTLSLFIFFSLILFLLSACISQKKIEYLQDPVVNETIYNLHEKTTDVIKPNDELYIKVSSFDDVSFNYFGEQSRVINTGYNSELGVTLISYTVNDSGSIYFPVIGSVNMNNLTLKEASEHLQNLLEPYFDQPMVTVKFAYKKITVVGEVNLPGYHTYLKDHITLFEALGMSGDMTVHGNRKKVYLLRVENETVKKIKLDLTNDAILSSEYYYLKPNDVLYVSSRKSTKWSIIATPIALILSTLTTSILILNYFN